MSIEQVNGFCLKKFRVKQGVRCYGVMYSQPAAANVNVGVFVLFPVCQVCAHSWQPGGGKCHIKKNKSAKVST